MNHINHKPSTDLKHPIQKFRVLQAALATQIRLRDEAIARISRSQKDAEKHAQEAAKLRHEIGELVPELQGYEQCQKKAQFLSRI